MYNIKSEKYPIWQGHPGYWVKEMWTPHEAWTKQRGATTAAEHVDRAVETRANFQPRVSHVKIAENAGKHWYQRSKLRETFLIICRYQEYYVRGMLYNIPRMKLQINSITTTNVVVIHHVSEWNNQFKVKVARNGKGQRRTHLGELPARWAQRKAPKAATKVEQKARNYKYCNKKHGLNLFIRKTRPPWPEVKNSN